MSNPEGNKSKIMVKCVFIERVKEEIWRRECVCIKNAYELERNSRKENKVVIL